MNRRTVLPSPVVFFYFYFRKARLMEKVELPNLSDLFKSFHSQVTTWLFFTISNRIKIRYI
jgi:hypothetical protein